MRVTWVPKKHETKIKYRKKKQKSNFIEYILLLKRRCRNEIGCHFKTSKDIKFTIQNKLSFVRPFI